MESNHLQFQIQCLIVVSCSGNVGLPLKALLRNILLLCNVLLQTLLCNPHLRLL